MRYMVGSVITAITRRKIHGISNVLRKIFNIYIQIKLRELTSFIHFPSTHCNDIKYIYDIYFCSLLIILQMKI